MTAREILAGVTDAALLAAIRRGDVSPVAAMFPYGGTFYERDTAMRGEAKRRGVL